MELDNNDLLILTPAVVRGLGAPTRGGAGTSRVVPSGEVGV